MVEGSCRVRHRWDLVLEEDLPQTESVLLLKSWQRGRTERKSLRVVWGGATPVVALTRRALEMNGGQRFAWRRERAMGSGPEKQTGLSLQLMF